MADEIEEKYKKLGWKYRDQYPSLVLQIDPSRHGPRPRPVDPGL